jgi:mRNA-degrading endonuclease RelE of RelBE toxin-antitoxin system
MSKMYSYEFDEELKEGLKKLAKKDKPLFLEFQKKVVQLIENPFLGKPLKNIMKGKRRVHLGHFVLIYELLDNDHKVIFLKLAHHDDAY